MARTSAIRAPRSRVLAAAGARPVPRPASASGPRVGVSRAADVAWRFWITGDPTVSPYRAHVPRRAGRNRFRSGPRRWDDASVTDIIDELTWRGLIALSTDPDDLRKALARARSPCTAASTPPRPGCTSATWCCC